MDWLTAFGFTMGWELHKQKKAEQKYQKFLADRRNGLADAVSELTEITTNLVLECGPIGLDGGFIEELKLAPFYAMGEVLSAQGEVYSAQEVVLKIMFANMDPIYNYAQFTEAVIHRTGVYEEYWNIVGLKKEECGTLWLTLFELIYRSRMIEAMQKIVDQLCLIVAHFSYLGNPDATFAKPICDRILDRLNHHVNAYQQTPYIHALMLLQNMLLEKRQLPIESHFFQREENLLQDGRVYYVFRVYEKSSEAFCGKFAVRKIKTVNGELDYRNDRDQILVWNEAADRYEQFYRELP